jgi:hypothetical protein
MLGTTCGFYEGRAKTGNLQSGSAPPPEIRRQNPVEFQSGIPNILPP